MRMSVQRHAEALALAAAMVITLLATFLPCKFCAYRKKLMDDSQLSELYRNRFAEAGLVRKNAIWRVICAHFLQSFIEESDTVVDLACGYGEFLNNIQATRKIGIDLNPDTASFLDEDIEFINGSVFESSSTVPTGADIVFTSNFLEHLPDKNALEQLLDEIIITLKPGGQFMILGPNLRYLPGEYWDFYDHNLGLTHFSLCEILQLKGFQIERCIDRFLPYTTQGPMPTHPLLVKIYLQVPLAWRFFGKQFFIIARKGFRH